MKLKKLLIVPMILAIIVGCFGVTAFASGAVDETPATITVPEYAVGIKYSEDSSSSKGISYETYIDPITFTVGFKIVENLPTGHIIYDDPETDYIDGIRINGETTTTLSVVVEQGVHYEVVVRTVYEDNLLGDFAKIVDGNFDFKTLLDNPITLLMGTYYVLSILSIVFASAIALATKNKKVQTADDIAAKVDASAQAAVEKIRIEATETVLAEAQPILQNILDGVHNIITALTLSTSKSKDAPLAMLDTLQKSASSLDATAIIDNIRTTIADGIQRDAETKEANAAILSEIAAKTEDVEASATTNPKSVF